MLNLYIGMMIKQKFFKISLNIQFRYEHLQFPTPPYLRFIETPTLIPSRSLPPWNEPHFFFDQSVHQSRFFFSRFGNCSPKEWLHPWISWTNPSPQDGLQQPKCSPYFISNSNPKIAFPATNPLE